MEVTEPNDHIVSLSGGRNSAAQLELRFQYEELCAENGLPTKGRPFFDGLRGYLAQHGEEKT